MSSLIFGIEQSAKREILVELFQQLLKGILCVPINFPFTCFNRSLQAREKIRTIVMDLIHEKRAAMEDQITSPQQDLITTLLSLRNADFSAALSDEEIVDNVILIMIAGYDTTSILLSFLINLLANNPSVYASVLQGTQLN
jgi:cytochrome P450 family 26 subfamily A